MRHTPFKTDQEKKLVFAMMLSSILPLLDSSIVNVILPSISKDIGRSNIHMQWTITAYMISCSAGILLSPFVNKRFGIKVSWLYSMSLFLIGSILVGLSMNMTLLITSRCLQGIGAGILMPVSQSALAIQFNRERLKSMMALVATPAVFAPALGPVVGAIITDSFNWRVAFFINIPIISISLAIGHGAIPTTERLREKFNLFVFLLFFISLACIFISIEMLFSQPGIQGVYKPVLLIGFSLLLISVFFNNISSNKVIYLGQFKSKEYASSITMGFLTSFIFFTFLIFFPLQKSYEQNASIVCIGGLLALQGVGAWLSRRFIYNKINDYNVFLIIGGGMIVSAMGIWIMEVGGIFFESLGLIVRGSGLGVRG
ncbi:MFS transporter [Vreelandella gomseomensis]|uniref:MFS transporter n=1 Tax=Vreelandella gomseomensis TaxID=370766 RepID=A0ABU1GAW3_9GAMM|nr:MFS transporter [Halomonas gomseomensis]MDR5874630.1 MFS transporter [Halomonas gomseomensis]